MAMFVKFEENGNKNGITCEHPQYVLQQYFMTV